MNKLLFNTIILFVLFFLPVQGLSAVDEIDEYFKGMTLEEKVGQIMLIGLQRKTLSKKDISLLKRIKPGGIIFYARNFEDASDIPRLVAEIKSTLENNDLPMFFAIDQEGGIVHRIKGEYHKPPSAPAIGAINSENLSQEIGFAVGNTLHDLGININLAPVLDVPVPAQSSPMKRRGFSNNTQTVVKLGTAYIAGLHDAGILATAKHFPGIGRAREDTHRTLPRITWETEDEKNTDILPFQVAVEKGVDVIMVGHVTAEPGDAENPISLSSYWMTDVLKKDMGFDGLVLIDNIEMKPIEDIMPVHEAAVKSFNAGADIIMVSHQRRIQKRVFNSLVHAVLRGTISLERLDDSVKRIIAAKKKLLSYRKTRREGRNLKELSRFVAENTVTALTLKNTSFQKTNSDDKVLFVGYNATIFNAVKDTFKYTDILNSSLSNYKKLYPEKPIEEFVNGFDTVLILFSYTDAPQIISLCNDLHKNYYFLQNFFTGILKTTEQLRPKQILIFYESNRENLHVVFEIIRGLRQAKGRLPSYINLPFQYIYTSPMDTKQAED